MGELISAIGHEVTDAGVLLITIDNRARRNALTPAMLGELIEVFADADADAGVRAVLLRGAGPEAFASGADLSELGGASPEAMTQFDHCYREACAAVRRCAKPVVASIRGVCFGAGLSIALEADVRIADSTAAFAIPAVLLGVAYAEVDTLVRVTGIAFASELLLTGRTVRAAEAEAVRLVNHAVEPAMLDARVDEVLGAFRRAAPLAVGAAKAALKQASGDARYSDPAVLEALIERCRRSDDLAEGIRAFADRRTPRFAGR